MIIQCQISFQRKWEKCETFRQATNFTTVAHCKSEYKENALFMKKTYCYENPSDSKRYLNSLTHSFLHHSKKVSNSKGFEQEIM